jgi:hypothetical protein
MGHTFGNGGVVLDTPEEIEQYRRIALAHALWLEIRGIRMKRGRTVYSMVKSEFGLRGNKQVVYQAFCHLIGIPTMEERDAEKKVGQKDGQVQ